MTCVRCDGDGYIERWNDDQTGVVTELCDCSMGYEFEGATAARPEDLPVPANADKRYEELDGG